MYLEAIQCYDKCVFNSSDSNAYIYKAECLLELRLFDEAIACYSQSCIIEPHHRYLAYLKKAKYIYQESTKKDFFEAINCLNEAIKIKPDCAESFHLKGLCLYEL